MSALIVSHSIVFPNYKNFKTIKINSSLTLKIDIIEKELQLHQFNVLLVIPSASDVVSETLSLIKKGYHPTTAKRITLLNLRSSLEMIQNLCNSKGVKFIITPIPPRPELLQRSELFGKKIDFILKDTFRDANSILAEANTKNRISPTKAFNVCYRQRAEKGSPLWVIRSACFEQNGAFKKKFHDKIQRNLLHYLNSMF